MKNTFLVTVIVFLALGDSILAQQREIIPTDFSFIVAGDMREFVHSRKSSERYFDGACEAIKSVGAGDFMVLPGDFDPPVPVRSTLDNIVGTNYFCYFAVGDHEAHSAENMAWFRRWAEAGIPHLVNRGPHGAEMTEYSFNAGNSHFVVLSDFFDGHREDAKPDVSDATIAWLEQDLKATHQQIIWVVSHKPIECLPDMDDGRNRHAGDSLIVDGKRREHFVKLLRQFHVRALLCGHTHGCSIAKVEGVWQCDSGHARGAADPGAPSTFLKIHVHGETAFVGIYRADASGQNYTLRKTIKLD